MSNVQKLLDSLAQAVYAELENANAVVVFAESCTAGLIAATLARVPGMSRRLAGSLVVYQIDSKVAWLAIDPDVIRRCDVVSREVAEAMATCALANTPHATVALSITGHLGPDAPRSLDGIAWLAIAKRDSRVFAARLNLLPGPVLAPVDSDAAIRIRHERQANAVKQALEMLMPSILGDRENALHP